jgi:hypothetical protein
VNIGSEETVTNQLAQVIMRTADKNLNIKRMHWLFGFRGRNFDNRLIVEMLRWKLSR